MASSDPSETLDRLINSRNRDLALLLPFLFAIPAAAERRNGDNPDQETPNATNPRDRIIFVNPHTQTLVIVEGGESGFDSLFQELSDKTGVPPASKSSIEALNDVMIDEDCESENSECAICLNEWKVGESVKEMPCKHKFCSKCIEKWLKIHGSCPVCRHQMPVDADQKDDGGEDQSGGGVRRVGRDFWVTLSINPAAATRDDNQD